MKRTLAAAIAALLILRLVSPAFAGGITWRTHPQNRAFICTVNYDGFVYGDCGNDAAGRGFINIATFRGNGECSGNSTLGGQAWHPEATQVLEAWRNNNTQHARVVAAAYLPEGASSAFCGMDESAGVSDGIGGDVMEYTATFRGDGLVRIDWTVTVAQDTPWMWLEVTTYNAGSLDTPYIWNDGGGYFAQTGYSMVEDWRQGISTGAPVLFLASAGFPDAGIAMSGAGVHHYDVWHFSSNLAKLSAVYEFTGLAAGDSVSGVSWIGLGSNAGAGVIEAMRAG